VVGIWRIETEAGKTVLAVDGRQWKEGQSSAGIADKARALYGERCAEFLDRVQAYAYYPYVVAKDVENFKNGEISVRFEGLSGRIDQGAGILFNLKPNGDYLTIRANCLLVCETVSASRIWDADALAPTNRRVAVAFRHGCAH